jgi:hypothetical protein
VAQLQTGLIADLKRQLPNCPTLGLELGKWTPEAGQGYGNWFVRKKVCPNALISFEPGRSPPNAHPLTGLSESQSTALASAVSVQTLHVKRPRSRARRVFDKVTLWAFAAGAPAGGIYLIATSPQDHGVRAGRLAGGIALTAAGAFVVCVALGPCSE